MYHEQINVLLLLFMSYIQAMTAGKYIAFSCCVFFAHSRESVFTLVFCKCLSVTVLRLLRDSYDNLKKKLFRHAQLKRRGFEHTICSIYVEISLKLHIKKC